MKGHGRKYGEKDSHPIYLWNGVLEPKHLKRLGPAFPLFVWFIDRTTQEQDGIGIVLGGKPVTAEEVAESMGVDERTTRRQMDRLEHHGYIERTLTPRGYTVRVMKSCKFPNHRVVVGQECPTTGANGRTQMSGQVGQECPTTPDKNVRANKSKQLEESVEEAGSRAALWQFLGVDGWKWSPAVREACENVYRVRNGQSSVELAGACMDAIEALGLRIPPALARRAAELRAQGPTRVTQLIPELEAEPWAK